MTTLPAEPILIRAMQNEDLETVRQIDQISFPMPWPESAYQFELNENPLSLLWVAEWVRPDETRQVVGMVVLWLIVDEAHIATIAVHPDYRRHGIGRRLIASALRGAVLNGCKTATLEVRQSNLAAQELYQRFQFEIVGSRPRYYRDNNEDALIMTASDLGNGYLEWLESGEWLK